MNMKIEMLLDGTWVPIEMKDLEIDDVFRMFSPEGISYKEGAMWMVLDEPYLNDDKIWTVDCEDVIGVIQV